MPRSRFLHICALCLSITILSTILNGCPRSEDDFDVVVSKESYRIRLLLIRHGFSCANLYHSACTTRVDLYPAAQLKRAMDAFDEVSQGPDPAAVGPINRSFGMKGQSWVDAAGRRCDDCCVKVTGPSRNLKDGHYSRDGNIVAIRHLYKDPMLTNCSASVSKEAGKHFADHLERNSVRLHFLGATTLMRTFETGYLMIGSNQSRFSTILGECIQASPHIVQVPFGNERDAGTPFEADNFPYGSEQQRQKISGVYGDEGLHMLDSGFIKGFPYAAQQLGKFKVVLATRLAEAARSGAPPRSQNSSGLIERLARSDLPETGPDLGEVDGKPRRQITWKDNARGSDQHFEFGPEFTASDWRQMRNAPVLNIAIFSHSSFVQDFCRLRKKPNNNAAVERLFHVEVSRYKNGSQRFLLTEQSGECHLVMDAPAAPTILAASDVRNCASGSFDYPSFVDMHSTVGPSGLTACELAGNREGAFPTFDFQPTSERNADI